MSDYNYEQGCWVTLQNGTHVFVRDGLTVEQAIEKRNKNAQQSNREKQGKKAPSKTEKGIMLPKKEYGEVCHAIRTKCANKIPKSGKILYKNHYYMYTYSKREEQILFTQRVPITSNKKWIGNYDEED